MIEFFSKINFLESWKGFWKVVSLKALKIVVVGPAQRSININVDNVINYVIICCTWISSLDLTIA